MTVLRLPTATLVALCACVAYGGSLWLVLLHQAEGGHEQGEPALLVHALRDGTLALPGVFAAAWLGATLAVRLVDRRRRLPAGWRAALTAAGAAVGAAVILAAGSPLHALLFPSTEAHQMPVALHLGRDSLIALAATLPLAAAVMALTARRGGRAAAPASRGRAAPRPPAPAPSRGLTRRSFVRVGAGSLAGAGVAGVALSRASHPASALEPSDRLHLFVNEGHVPMVDGTLVYMRGYGDAATGDPQPSLTIAPQAFLRDGHGPIAGRHYPPDAPVPHDGAPTGAGIDPAATGAHHIHRRHWASIFPRRTIVAETGSQVRLRITNRLAGPHTFTIDGVVDVTLGPAGTADAARDVEFAAPGPGTYVFHDTTDAPVNRVLGLFGVLVVVPADARWTLDGSEGEFERQWLWIFHDIDPEWSRRARMGATIDPRATPPAPRYFTINDRSGVYSIAHSPDEAENHRTLEDTKPAGHARRVDCRDFSDPQTGTGQLIRLVNTGVAVHQPHFHGNHVWTLSIDNVVLSRSDPTMSSDGHIQLQQWEDVVELDPLHTKAVILPLKPPPDALDAVLAARECDWVYPMHCHAEMSQTAGGGLYPGGMVTDWILKA